MQNKRRLFLFLLVLAAASSADDRLHLQRADILENKTINGRQIKFLRGDVVVTKRDVTMNCDNARYNEQTGQGVLIGKVKIIQKDLTLTCDSLRHDSPNDLMICYGRVHVWDPDYDLVCDTLHYYTELDSGSATGDVTLVQESQVINARLLTYWKPPEAEAASYTAEREVVITESGRVATCGRAVYAANQEKTTLTIDPVVEDNGQLISGAEIELTYRDEVLHKAFIPDKARVEYRSRGKQEVWQVLADTTVIDSQAVEFTDEMTGNVLHGFFIDGKLDSMRLEGMAETLYHVFEDSVYQGRNNASGDTIVMHFNSQELRRIGIDGGARGKYIPDTSGAEIEAPIVYQSDAIDYDVIDETTDLKGRAKIDYTDVNLTSGFVNVAWQRNVLKALPAVPYDSTFEESTPTINERGREPMTGTALTYNLTSRHGRVEQGRTKTGDGYYSGRDIRNTDKSTFFIAHSSYTTCDKLTPHFHFAGRRMKMINKDKVVIRPIVFYIAGIPLMALPLGIFPHQGGDRHSGWLMPGYGENRFRGQHLTGLGYYWAPNSYWDSRTLIDFGDRWGFRLRLLNRYKIRYKFNGNLNMEVLQKLQNSNDITSLFEPGSTTDYVVKWNHTQVMRNYQSLRVRATYQSNVDYQRENEVDLAKRLNQKANSNLTYSKRWPESKNSISLNLNYSRDLMAENKIDSTSDFYQKPNVAGTHLNISTSKLPSFSYRHGQEKLFPGGEGQDLRWYHNIAWNFSTNLNRSTKSYFESKIDTAGILYWDDDPQSEADQLLTHNASISGPQKILKYISINPRLSLNSKWVDHSFAIAGLDSATNTIITRKDHGLAALTTGRMGVSINTKVYGLVPLRIGSLQAIRHTISPSISYNYTPDFSKPVFGQDLGYISTITDTAGQTLKLDRFQGTPAGRTPVRESQSMSLSVKNIVQSKWLKEDKEIKRDLFSYNLSSRYNFMADEFKLGVINSTFRSKLGKKFNINLRMTHDLYQFDPVAETRINKINYDSRGIPVPRLTKASMSQSFNFSGDRIKPIVVAEVDTTLDSIAVLEGLDGLDEVNDRVRETRNKAPLKDSQLWTAGFSFSYTLTNPGMQSEVERFQMNSNLKLQLTANWRINYSASFDLISRNLLNHSFSIYRDLHCWEMSISWQPSGYARGFYLKIQPKSPQLKDIKLEQKGGRRARVY